MEPISLTAFIDRHGLASRQPFATIDALTTPLRYPKEEPNDFVAPDLRLMFPAVNGGRPRVVLVSAPGALGKSTLACHLAYATGAPLWDLAATSPVAMGSVDGALNESFGDQAYPLVLEAISAGRQSVIIDALDEGRLKALAATAFDAFLDNLARRALKGQTGGPPAFVLFGRTRIVEDIWETLEAAGASAEVWQIEPFDDDQSRRYVDARTLRVARPEIRDAIARHPVAFAEVCDELRQQVFRMLAVEGESSQVRHFLGYAPVLDALAYFLTRGKNFAEIRQDVARLGERILARDGVRPSDLLSSIIERILVREAEQKVQGVICEALGAEASLLGWDQWTCLYNAPEQVQRLLARFLGVPYVATEPTLPPALKSAYEQQMKVWVREHPFLHDGCVPANSIFEAFLLARGLREAGALRDATLRRLREPRQPLPWLADFLFAILGERPALKPDELGPVYESLLARERTDAQLFLELAESEQSTTEVGLEGEFQLEAGGREETLPFVINAEPGATLSFPRRLRRAMIVVEQYDVEFGTDTGSFELGPGVTLTCNQLIIDARELVLHIDRQTEDGGVELEASHYIGPFAERPRLLLSSGQSGAQFSVCWPDCAAFPWTEFASEAATLGDPRVSRAYARLRRIAMTFRSNKKGALKRRAAKVESMRVLKGEGGRQLLDTMREVGIVRREAQVYEWMSERASEIVGVSWQHLKARKVTPKTETFLNAFLANHPNAF